MNHKKEKIKLIVIGGPTSSGKTGLGIELCKKIGGEIINADSVQVYRHFDIGSNKGNLKKISSYELDISNGEKFSIPIMEVEDSGIKGHLFDVADPDESFDISIYRELVEKIIYKIHKSKQIPVLVGGSGLYIDSVIKNYNLEKNAIDEDYREYLNSLSKGELQELLLNDNKDTFERLNNSDRNNPRRLIRLIEKKKTNQKHSDVSFDNNFDITFLYPEFNRTKLIKKIDKRVIEMFEEGLVEEVKGLLDWYPKNKSLRSAGYRQVVEYLTSDKYKTESECIKSVQASHRQLAKRQITWFEGDGRGYNLIKTSLDNIQEIVKNFNF